MEEIIEKYLDLKDAKIEKLEFSGSNELYKINDQYVIKKFNKDVIQNENERDIREVKAQIVEKMKENGINAVTPYKYNGRYIQKNDSYFSIYPYIPYKPISREEIQLEHIQELARVIRNMHSVKFNASLSNATNTNLNINFDKYIFAHKDNVNMRSLLMKNKAKLEYLESRINKALGLLKGKVVISHNNLNLNNVLWNKFNSYLIGWNNIVYINHMCAANYYAYFWSTNEGELNKDYYKDFMKLYTAKHECNDNIYDIIYATLYSKFSLFMYSLERSINNDIQEAKKGEVAVAKLIEEIIIYEKNIPEMVGTFNTIDERFGV